MTGQGLSDQERGAEMAGKGPNDQARRKTTTKIVPTSDICMNGPHHPQGPSAVGSQAYLSSLP